MDVVWPWRERASVDEGVNAGISRKHVLIESIIVLTVGLIIRCLTAKYIIGTIVLCVGSVTLISGLWLHPLYRALKRLGNFLAKWVGLLVTWMLLVPFFYLAFPIGRLLFALRGKDLLSSKFLGEKESYWTKWSNPKDKGQYRKQF